MSIRQQPSPMKHLIIKQIIKVTFYSHNHVGTGFSMVFRQWAVVKCYYAFKKCSSSNILTKSLIQEDH